MFCRQDWITEAVFCLVLAVTVAAAQGCPDQCQQCAPDGQCRLCHAGFYGKLCTETCTGCWEDRCNMTTGRCINCKPGSYSEHCNLTCTGFCRKDIQGLIHCGREDGECLNGCDISRWGTHCQHNCSETCSDSVCYKQDGRCLQCMPNWFGKHCETCSGSSCRTDVKCPHKCSQCIIDTCINCTDGWNEHTCEIPEPGAVRHVQTCRPTNAVMLILSLLILAWTAAVAVFLAINKTKAGHCGLHLCRCFQTEGAGSYTRTILVMIVLQLLLAVLCIAVVCGVCASGIEAIAIASIVFSVLSMLCAGLSLSMLQFCGQTQQKEAVDSRQRLKEGHSSTDEVTRSEKEGGMGKGSEECDALVTNDVSEKGKSRVTEDETEDNELLPPNETTTQEYQTVQVASSDTPLARQKRVSESIKNTKRKRRKEVFQTIDWDYETKRKVKDVLEPDFMSDEEWEDEGKTLVVTHLAWASDEFNEYKKELDNEYFTKNKGHIKLTYSSNRVSSLLLVPHTAPQWIRKKSDNKLA